MKEFWANLDLLVVFVNHLLPIAITLFAVFVFWLIKVYLPQLQYLDLVANATDDAGIEALAKYMARRNGGKHIRTGHHWEAFIPAAKAVSEDYRDGD